jgi:hypothetical protein
MVEEKATDAIPATLCTVVTGSDHLEALSEQTDSPSVTIHDSKIALV